MKVGVIGLGAIAPYFLRALESDPSLTLAAVCDLDSVKMSTFSEVARYTSYEKLLDESGVEAVVITLPNFLHAPAVQAALDRGIHVCCEKPLAVTSEEAVEMARRARAGGATLFTAFHRRYNTNLVELLASLPERREIAEVRARYHENIAEHTGGDAWYLDISRCGGGCLIDNGPNALDSVRHLVGPMRVVDASIGDVRSGCEFVAEVRLETPDAIPVTVELDWALPTGEVKDVTVVLRDGTELHADMLAGYDEFKSSLEHEYVGILAEFRAAIAGPDWVDPGPEIVAVVEEAYRVARRKETRLRMSSKGAATARVVKLLYHSRDDRGMRLSEWRTRAVRVGEIHELVTTTDAPVDPGDRVYRVGFLGFVEFSSPTVIGRGDEVYVDDRRIGTVAGFDECHFPNHYNILIDTDAVVSAGDIDLKVADVVRFVEVGR
jgi:predicted dehydrogenase